MVDFVSIGTGIGGLKAALDILQGLKSTADAVAINDAKIALQSAIIEAQSGLMAAQEAQTTHLDRIRNLEAQIAQFEDWEREQEGYLLIEIYDGAFAYANQLPVNDGEPLVWLCTNCFGNRKMAILQRGGTAFQVGGGRGSHMHWGCPSCGKSINVPVNLNPSRIAERRERGA